MSGERPAWLNFEDEKRQEGEFSAPRYETDPRGEPSADRSAAVARAMEPSQPSNPGQNFAVISFVSPNGTFQHADQMLLKVYEACPTIEKAREQAAIISQENSDFDVFIISMNSWVPFPPQASIHREGDDTISNVLNTFYEKQEIGQSELQERVEAARQEGAAPAKAAEAEKVD